MIQQQIDLNTRQAYQDLKSWGILNGTYSNQDLAYIGIGITGLVDQQLLSKAIGYPPKIHRVLKVVDHIWYMVIGEKPAAITMEQQNRIYCLSSVLLNLEAINKTMQPHG